MDSLLYIKGLRPAVVKRVARPGLFLEEHLGQQHPQAEQDGESGAGGDDFHNSFRSSDWILTSSIGGKCYQQFNKMLILCYIPPPLGPAD